MTTLWLHFWLGIALALMIYAAGFGLAVWLADRGIIVPEPLEESSSDPEVDPFPPGRL
jgi:hypothetical protein